MFPAKDQLFIRAVLLLVFYSNLLFVENKPNKKKALPPIGKQIDNTKVAGN